MAYEQVQKPSSSFVPVKTKVSEFALSASRVQAKDDTAGEQEQIPKVSTPATDANWLMKHPLFKGNQFLQREVAPASESESLESEEETLQRQEEGNATGTPYSLPVQAKLTIGEPGDKYEQEADRVASQVVKQINSPEAASSSQGQSVQRREEPVEELQRQPSISDLQRTPLPLEVQREAMPAEEELQAKSILQRREAIAGGEASTDLDTAINSARGGGQSLDAGLQRSMGQAMGADFSGVKVHTDAQSDQLNQSIQAKAFTTGQDVFFRQGEYNPGSRGGQELIAHELTHVVQQSGGAVQRSPLNSPQQSLVSPLQAKLTIGEPGDKYEQEADRVASQVVQQINTPDAAQSTQGQSVQRQEEPVEELQRQPEITALQSAERNGPHPVQRLVRFNYTQWINGETSERGKIETYWKDFIVPEYSLAINAMKGMEGLDVFDDMKEAFSLAKKQILTRVSSKNWDGIDQHLNTLMATINQCLTYAKTGLNKDVDSYSNTREDSWQTKDEALNTMDKLASASKLSHKPAGKQPKKNEQGQPNIPGIKWSEAKGQLPGALRNLIRDIHTSWRLGEVMDERDEQARTRKEKNPNVAGALRTWHVNEQGQLPNIEGLQTPNNAAALHTHYKDTAQHPYDKNNTAGPTGYAEYTGTGIKNDFHYSKLVLDYKQGIMYVTVTHYQNWKKSEGGVGYEIGDKQPNEGYPNSAWFYIDMHE
jgi:hypothetical protein